jgi:hypothetical protein
MKKAVFAAILMMSSVCYARLCETYGQCVERYGKPIKQEDDFFGSLKGDPKRHECTYTFKKGKFEIQITFFNNKAFEIVYKTRPPISDAEVLAILHFYDADWKVADSYESEYGSLVCYRNPAKTFEGAHHRSIVSLGSDEMSSYFVTKDLEITEHLTKKLNEKKMKEAKKSIDGL